MTHTPKELLAELQALVAEAETMMAGSISEHSAKAFGNLRDRFNAVHDRVGAAYTEARKKVVTGARYTDEAIRANPYSSLAIAAGIGFLVGVLVSRRDN